MCPPVCASMQRQLQNSSKRCCHGCELTDGACRVGLYADYCMLPRFSCTPSPSAGSTMPMSMVSHSQMWPPQLAFCRKRCAAPVLVLHSDVPSHSAYLQEEALCHIHGQH